MNFIFLTLALYVYHVGATPLVGAPQNQFRKDDINIYDMNDINDNLIAKDDPAGGEQSMLNLDFQDIYPPPSLPDDNDGDFGNAADQGKQNLTSAATTPAASETRPDTTTSTESTAPNTSSEATETTENEGSQAEEDNQTSLISQFFSNVWDMVKDAFSFLWTTISDAWSESGTQENANNSTTTTVEPTQSSTDSFIFPLADTSFGHELPSKEGDVDFRFYGHGIA